MVKLSSGCSTSPILLLYGRPTIMDPQGNPRTTSAIGNALMFQGRQYDPETGFYWYRTRYYDPRAGRFTSRDSIGIWGDPLNLGNGYTFVGNNPWTNLDPYGLYVDTQDIPNLDGSITRHFYDRGWTGWFKNEYRATVIFDPDVAEDAQIADDFGRVQQFLATARNGSSAAATGMKIYLATNPVANALEAATGQSMSAPAGTKLGVVDRGLSIASTVLPVTKLATAGKVADAANDLNKGKKALTAAELEADAKKLAGVWEDVCKWTDASKKALPLKPKWTGKITEYKKGAMSPIEHIFYRHGPTSGFKDVGKFAPGTRARDVVTMVEEAAQKGNMVFDKDGRASVLYDFGRVIGTHKDGSAATRLQVFMNQAGEVQTAYPLK